MLVQHASSEGVLYSDPGVGVLYSDPGVGGYCIVTVGGGGGYCIVTLGWGVLYSDPRVMGYCIVTLGWGKLYSDPGGVGVPYIKKYSQIGIKCGRQKNS